MNYFWPVDPGITFFDVWSISHLGFWVVVGSSAWALRLDKYVTLIVCLLVAYGWEAFERFAETRWPHIWLSPESFINSTISDPLMCVVGFLGIWFLLDRSKSKWQQRS
jgi:hypothetical protein